MVGVELSANWVSTRKVNNDELQRRVQCCINSWKSGKFMPLISRPFSLNTYCSSKIWFRTGSVDLRGCDVAAITSKLKSYCYQDLFQKPSEVTLYRRVDEGGLGLHHIQSKAQANLISIFMQTAANKNFRGSLFHSWLFRFHIEGDRSLPDPGFTPYYDRKFFALIKSVQQKTSLNIVYLSVKQWYHHLLELNVIKTGMDEDRVSELIPCRIEVKNPNVSWLNSYSTSRMKGLSPDNKSFLFKLIHELLPSKERLHSLGQSPSSLCWCNSGESESYQHLFFHCEKNVLAGQALFRCVRAYDSCISEQKCLRLELESDDPFRLASVCVLSAGFELIWNNRKQRKTTSIISIRAEMEMEISIKRKSRLRNLQECANIMENMINNFLN